MLKISSVDAWFARTRKVSVLGISFPPNNLNNFVTVYRNLSKWIGRVSHKIVFWWFQIVSLNGSLYKFYGTEDFFGSRICWGLFQQGLSEIRGKPLYTSEKRQCVYDWLMNPPRWKKPWHVLPRWMTSCTSYFLKEMVPFLPDVETVHNITEHVTVHVLLTYLFKSSKPNSVTNLVPGFPISYLEV